MSIKDIMLKTNEKLNQNLIECLGENELKFSHLLLNLELIDEWNSITKDFECSKMLHEVSYDLLTSMYFVGYGLYRNAFISLRSALELGLGFVYFVDRNYQYLLWKKDAYDIKWADLSDMNQGVLSNSYLSLFYNHSYDDFINTTKGLYRECSEYVHGKHDYMQTLEKLNIEYNLEKFKEWNKAFEGITEIIIILLSVRFNTKVHLLEDDKLITLKDILTKYELREVAASDV